MNYFIIVNIHFSPMYLTRPPTLWQHVPLVPQTRFVIQSSLHLYQGMLFVMEVVSEVTLLFEESFHFISFHFIALHCIALLFCDVMYSITNLYLVYLLILPPYEP